MAQRVILVQDSTFQVDGKDFAVSSILIETMPVGSFTGPDLQMRLRPFDYSEGVQGEPLTKIDGVSTVNVNLTPAEPGQAFDGTFGNVYQAVIAELETRQSQWAGKCSYVYL